MTDRCAWCLGGPDADHSGCRRIAAGGRLFLAAMILTACNSKNVVSSVVIRTRTVVDTSWVVVSRDGRECTVRNAAPAVNDTVFCWWGGR